MTDRVTIELKNKPNNGPPYTCDYQANTTGGGKSVTISVTRHEDSPGFYRYTHENSTKDSYGKSLPFRLKEIQDENGKIGGVRESQDDKEVTSVEAYYWRHENGGGQTPTKVLLVGVTAAGSDGTKYYVRSSGKEWVEKRLNGDLEKILDEQNCYSNDAITLDLSRNNSEQPKYGKGYCCDDHKNSPRVTVEEIPVSHKHHNHGRSAKFYKHTIGPTSKLAGIKYNEGGSSDPKNRKRVTLNGQPFPIPNVKNVYALYSGESKEPKLIYVNSTGGSGVSGWFKKGSGTNGNWEKAEKLNSITPENFRDLDCNNWKALKEELNHDTSDLEECQESKQQLEQRQQEAQRSGGEESEGQGYKADAGGKEARAQEQGTSPKKPDPNDKAKGPGDTAPGLSGSAVDEASGNADGDSHSEGTQSPAAKESASEPQARSGAEAGTALPHGQGNSPGQNPSFWDKPEKSIPTVLTGVGVVSGLVGLAGFKYYKSHNGDPWVRQIS
ncbi:hypothetical protein BEWA_025190 [Theileria equi strain WA]|uniref:Uncharacterized protein n=1 Tax=Theileria equi strain WA TaxID=1537102 RepID=L0AVU3_THEEQ|nr:hypothetical protein BEWA_025190 [Theileria equi strain WA]AFZ79670.1 hypothetical protein BEWA_025190 [Theileria equi strain WA]|eukprot:XP_004829336.1 hypothetical protein BEWA_025190 [Theileria equi strain WA]